MKRWSVDARLVVVFVVLALWAGRILSWRDGYEEGYTEGRFHSQNLSSTTVSDPGGMWVYIDTLGVGETDTFRVAITRVEPGTLEDDSTFPITDWPPGRKESE